MSNLKQSIADAGGVTAVALACGLSPRAIYKWISAGSMPRTEYTGETDYAKKIARLAKANGHQIDASELRRSASPKKSAA
ncbi:TPA: hypothetical protein ACWMBB_006645 [Pseudomonas aeruginosa]